MSNQSSFYPVLGAYFDENQSSDYVSGTYKFEQDKSKNDKNLHFNHILKGENLISQFFDSGEIDFCITTVVKSTMYRHTFLADKASVQKSSNIIQIPQSIKVLEQNEIRYYFGCAIYTGEDRQITLNSDIMGLDSFWNNVIINLKKGQILARSSWSEDQKSIGDFISVEKDENIKCGFKVEVDSNGLFLVKMNEKDFLNLQNEKNKQSKLYISIVNNILSVALYELEKFSQNNELDDKFKQLIKQIEAKGFVWGDEGFMPSMIAASFVPFKFDESEKDDD
ncbi:hypothetical protein OFO01_03390 [Campylobacter sp. JMF_01 NE2]|uniref:hypothetical protein n=1 Tax=unclassified Campylobacter TaxID=2593542 RepID=UPI0022E9C558|nr:MULTISPECIES: hypothetical protein [unclassified Campylobacter]MDA3052487.1 hypothetical protein [Campylobacter sp. JMF_03 NE3]MDA3066820.1 hypothetical protein [Campylobacter sp. JMF_01 NE2]